MKKIFLSFPSSWLRQATGVFYQNLFSISEVNCQFIDMHPCLGSIFNVFQNKVSRRSTTAINTYKNLFDQHFAFLELLFLEFGQREVILLFMLGWALCYLFRVNKHWHRRMGWEIESSTVKGSISLNLRHCWVRFQLYLTANLVRYNLNLTLRCHRITILHLSQC